MSKDKDLLDEARNNGIILSYGDDEPIKDSKVETPPTEDNEASEKIPEKEKSTEVEDVTPINPDDFISATIKIVDDSTDTNRIKIISGLKGAPILESLNGLLSAWLSNNYELASELPKEIEDGETLEVHIKHKEKPISRSKTVEEVIEYSTNDDANAPDKKVQTLTFEQKGFKDLVTDKNHWDKRPLEQSFDAVPTPKLPGYTPDTDEIKAVIVSIDNNNFNDDLNIHKIVNYLVDKQTVTIKLYDETLDKILDEIPLSGFTNHIANFNLNKTLESYADYKVVENNLPDTIVFQPDDSNVYTVKLAHKTRELTPENPINPVTSDELELSKTVTHIIKRNAPNKTFDDIKQSVKFKRTAIVDLVTGKVIYNKYQDKLTLPEITLENIPGYQSATNKIEALDVTADTKDIVETVDIKPLKHTVTIKFVDVTIDKSIIDTEIIEGYTDETKAIDLTDKISDLTTQNYELLENPVKNNVTFGTEDQMFIIKFDHKKSEITINEPLNPKTGADLSKKLERTVTRSVEFTTPDEVQAPAEIDQKVEFTRTASIDLVTNKVTYDEWSENKTLKMITIPEIKGYTPYVNDKITTQLEAQKVNGNTSDSMVNVIYRADKQVLTFTFYDEDSNINLATEEFEGSTNSELNFNLKVLIDAISSKGYTVQPYSFDLTKYPNENRTFKINFKHTIRNLEPNDEDIPENVQLRVEYQYTLSFVDKNNHDLLKPLKVPLILTRTARYDEATKEATYSEWHRANKFPREIKLQPISGMVPLHPIIQVPDLTKEHSDQYAAAVYVAESQKVTVDIITNNDEQVKTYTFRFKYEENKKLPMKLLVQKIKEQGYELDANYNKNLPEYLDYDKALPDVRSYKMVVRELFDSDIETRKVTRTIAIVNPDKSRRIIQQIALLTRVVETGKATGRTIKHDWSMNMWDAYTPTPIAGYMPNTKDPSETIVNEDTKDQVINISYIKIPDHPEPQLEEPEETKHSGLNWFKRIFRLGKPKDQNDNDNLKLEAPKPQD